MGVKLKRVCKLHRSFRSRSFWISSGGSFSRPPCWGLGVALTEKRGLSLTGRAGEAIPVRMVRRLHCSSTPPCRLPLWVKGISNMKRRMLWDLSNSVFLSCNSFSSKNGITWVTWMYAYLESRSLGLTFKWIKGMEYCYWCLKDSSNAYQSCVFPLRMSKSFVDSESLKKKQYNECYIPTTQNNC